MMIDIADPRWLVKKFSSRFSLELHEANALNSLTISTRTYEPGQYLLREGDRPKVCAFLHEGFVYRHKIVGDGGRQILSIHVPHDFIDVQNILLGQADHNIQALTHAAIFAIPIDEMIALAMAHPSICKALWTESLVEASLMREWVANVGRRDARSRTAHMLCEVAIRREAAGLGPRDNFDLPMTQEQLGDALGLTAVHVNRTLKTLENDGLITRNKRSVTVADWRGLQRVGDFTSAYLHLAEAADPKSEQSASSQGERGYFRLD